MAANVKIKLIVDDNGALQTLKDFNKSMQKIADTQKGLNNQFTRTFSNVSKQSKKARDNFKQLGLVAKNGFTKANRAIKKTRKEVGALSKAGSQIKNIFAGVFIADTLRLSINALKNAFVGSIKTMAEFEDGLIGVGKTVNIVGPELAALGEDIRNLNVPVSNADLLELAKTAGQLGVRGSKNILKFTETMARLESATDVAGEAGAQAIARILNVTGEAVENVDVFGSILVALGNNSEATESQILHMTNEVARATGHFGVSAEQALAFGAAMKSLGIRAEGGGTAVGKIFKLLDRAVSEQSPKLQKFAEVIGITGKQLTESFREDKVKTVLSVLKGLGQDSDNLNTNLSKLGLNSERTSKVIAPLALRFEKLSESFGLAAEESKKNTALTIESDRAFKSLNKTWDLLEKQVSSAATEIVTTFAPAMKGLIKATTEYIKIFRGIDETKGVFAGLGFDSGKTTAQLETDKDKIVQIIRDLKAELDKPIGRSATDRAKRLEDVKRLSDEEARLLRVNNLIQKQELQDFTDAYVANLRTQTTAVNEELNKRGELLKLFSDTQALQEQTDKEKKDILAVVDGTDRFDRLVEAFGKEDALDIVFKARKLERESDQNKGIALLRQKDLEAQKKIAKQKLDLLTKSENAKVNILSSFSNLATAVAQDGSKAAFLIQKAAAFASVFVAGKQATALALATPPGPPVTIPLAKSVALAANINLAAIGASAIKGFQNGGIVPGSSFSGDNVPAKVNSGEMILNRQQQATLFKQANGATQQGGPQEIVVHTNVQIDEETVFKAVSRQVANGGQLGEVT